MHRDAYEAALKAERDAVLDDILSRWHHWASKASPCRGYAPRSCGFVQYRASRQYDDQNGALDTDLEADTMATVDFQVREMADPWRSAIYANARNLCLGLTVWSSPRLPADPLARAAVLVEARHSLTQRLLMAGVM